MISYTRRLERIRCRDSEQHRVRRQLLATATDDDAVAEWQSILRKNRDQQRLRRDRLRARTSPSLPPFIPSHQVRALKDFLDRLFLVRSDLHECETCHERYYGLKLHADQCDRCHREVWVFPLALRLGLIRLRKPDIVMMSLIKPTPVSFLSNSNTFCAA